MEENKKKILNDPDFVNSPKYEYSLAKVLDRHPEGLSDRAIARLLMIEEDEIEEIYLDAVERLKKEMKV
jgi:hypothetical protein